MNFVHCTARKFTVRSLQELAGQLPGAAAHPALSIDTSFPALSSHIGLQCCIEEAGLP